MTITYNQYLKSWNENLGSIPDKDKSWWIQQIRLAAAVCIEKLKEQKNNTPEHVRKINHTAEGFYNMILHGIQIKPSLQHKFNSLMRCEPEMLI